MCASESISRKIFFKAVLSSRCKTFSLISIENIYVQIGILFIAFPLKGSVPRFTIRVRVVETTQSTFHPSLSIRTIKPTSIDAVSCIGQSDLDVVSIISEAAENPIRITKKYNFILKNLNKEVLK